MKNLGWIGITAAAVALSAVPLIGVATVAQHEAHAAVATSSADTHVAPAEVARTAVVTVTMNGTTTQFGRDGAVSLPAQHASPKVAAHEMDIMVAVSRLFFGAIWR